MYVIQRVVFFFFFTVVAIMFLLLFWEEFYMRRLHFLCTNLSVIQPQFRTVTMFVAVDLREIICTIWSSSVFARMGLQFLLSH
jgi:hypothetical protein